MPPGTIGVAVVLVGVGVPAVGVGVPAVGVGVPGVGVPTVGVGVGTVAVGVGTVAFGGSLRPGTLATLVGAILVPVVAFVLAALATRGRPVAARVLVMLAGLAAASALTVGLAALLPLL